MIGCLWFSDLWSLLRQSGPGAELRAGVLVDVGECVLDINYATLEVQHRYPSSSSFMLFGVVTDLWSVYQWE